MKIKKGLKKYILCGLIVVSATGGLVGYNKYQQGQKALHIVQNGRSNINTECTYKQAFESYLMDISWCTYKNSEGKQIVNITGERYSVEKQHSYKYSINYLITGNTFKLYKATMDGVEMNEVEVLMLTIKAMDSYDSVDNF